MNVKPTEAQIRHEIESIKNYLVAAGDVVKSGHMPSLDGLENRIARLCESIQQSEAATQKICLPGLHTLIELLDGCEKEMRESRKTEASDGGKS
jgi:hypothetical protein